MLGGSSGLNFTAYSRPSTEDIDDWSSALGLQGWSWSDLLPYFKRSERLESGHLEQLNGNLEGGSLDQECHGLDGNIYTSLTKWQVPFETELGRAFDEESGLPRLKEPYNGYHTGFYRSLFTVNRTEKPTRSYAANGYLTPVAGRENLKVLTNACVRRIILERREEGTEHASGVNFQYDGALYSTFARREVVLCAGAIQSPQLLELSGIGDPKVLEDARIHCMVPNPHVGKNLQEHTMSAVVYELAPGVVSLDLILQDPALLQAHQTLYQNSYSGAFSGCVNLAGCISYASQVGKSEFEDTIAKLKHGFHTNITSPSQNEAFQTKQQEAIISRMRSGHSSDILLIGTPANFDIARGYNDCSKLTPGAPAPHNGCYSVTVSNMYPVSRGSVHIRTANYQDAPLIDPGFLTHPVDVDILAAGVAFADRVFQSPRLKELVARRVDPPSEVDIRNKNMAREFVRDRIVTYHHALGTCAMGQVVDERLRVKGVHGLRVVDASVFPMQISAAIIATVYAVAEKASDMIKEDLQSKSV